MQSGEPFADTASRYWSLIDRSDGIASHFTADFLEGLGGYRTFNEFVPRLTRFRDAELLNRILYYETTNWLPALLQVEDRLSMACSLESRVPILDVRIVDLAFSLPTVIKMRNGQTKAVLREACRDLLATAIREGKETFEEAGGPEAYFGYPAQASAEEGHKTIETLGQILAEAVMQEAGD